MPKAKHTPEPWQIRSDEEPGCQPLIEIIGKHGNKVCQFFSHGEVQPAKVFDSPVANAKRVIACFNACNGINPDAVPDMLAALKAVEKYVSAIGTCPVNETLPSGRVPMGMVRNAIAKATGSKS